METISAVAFIGTIVLAITQGIKLAVPSVNGWVTILVAALVGGLVALVDVQIGLTNITVAVGILTGLSSAGVMALRKG